MTCRRALFRPRLCWWRRRFHEDALVFGVDGSLLWNIVEAAAGGLRSAVALGGWRARRESTVMTPCNLWQSTRKERRSSLGAFCMHQELGGDPASNHARALIGRPQPGRSPPPSSCWSHAAG